MNKTKLVFIVLCTLFFTKNGYSQVNYSLKAESGYLSYLFTTVQIDPGPEWKGYYLESNGIDFNVINGIEFNNKLFAGIGLGYLNFDGINGLSVYTDFEYLPLASRITPLINLKMGYSHLWNQYENGSGTALGELGVGVNYKLTEQTAIYAKSGFTMTQQAFLVPLRIGIRF